MADRNEETIKKVVEGVEAAERERDYTDEITLSTGIVLKLRPMPQHLVAQVSQRFTHPKPPLVMNESKGVEEPNENDPDYHEAQEQFLFDISTATTNVMILRGTEVISIPKGVMKPDSDAWKSEMEIYGLPMIENKSARYLAWIKGIAAPLEQDIHALMKGVGRLTGVSEEDVEEAVRRFPGFAAQKPDTET